MSSVNASGIALSEAVEKIRQAASILFAADPSIRSVGVGEVASGYGFVAVRNERAPVAYSAKIGKAIPDELDGIPVQIINSQADPSSLARVPYSGPASPGVGSLIPEQQHRPLVCGLQIQNLDNDVRTGELLKATSSSVHWVAS